MPAPALALDSPIELNATHAGLELDSNPIGEPEAQMGFPAMVTRTVTMSDGHAGPRAGSQRVSEDPELRLRIPGRAHGERTQSRATGA